MKTSTKRAEEGFVLLEVIISMIVLAIIIVGTLIIKDMSMNLNSESQTRIRAANGVLQRERAFVLNNYTSAQHVFIKDAPDCDTGNDSRYCSYYVKREGMELITQGVGGDGVRPVQVNSADDTAQPPAPAGSVLTPSHTTVYRYVYRAQGCMWDGNTEAYRTGDGPFDPSNDEICPTLIRIVVEANGGNHTPPDGIASQEFFFNLPKARFTS